MADVDLRVISIGAPSTHGLRGETRPMRTGHATCTLVRSRQRVILVDPGLPGVALAARLEERAGVRPEDVTHVFLTSFQPDTTRGIDAFAHATWWIAPDEREGAGVPLAMELRDAARAGEGGDPTIEPLRRQVAMLQRAEPAPDRLADHVDLFPLPGVTPGLAGLLVTGGASATLICGDAIPTVEHLLHGRVPPGALDVERAMESFKEALEIGDLLVLGRDNMVLNPARRVL